MDNVSSKEWASIQSHFGVPTYKGLGKSIQGHLYHRKVPKKLIDGINHYRVCDLEAYKKSHELPEKYAFLRTDDKKYFRSASNWIKHNRKHPVILIGTRNCFHTDDIEAFENQYTPAQNIDLQALERSIETHAPSYAAILRGAGYKPNTSNLTRFYFKRYPHLKELYEKRCTEIDNQKRRVISKVRAAVQCHSYEEALGLTGLDAKQFDRLLRKHTGIVHIKSYYRLRERVKVVGESKHLTEAADKLGLSISAMSHYVSRNREGFERLGD
ncbi:MAG: LysR family transcriptional regulator [Deinococcota bacterium]